MPTIRFSLNRIASGFFLLCASTFSAHAAEAELPIVEVRDNSQPKTKNNLLGVQDDLIDLPYSISVISSDVLQDQGGLTLIDMLRNVPGAQADLSFTGRHSQVFALRGFVADSGTGASRVSRDGARLSNYPFVPAFVDSVQILRGPGAATGTRSEPGGTVQIVTRQPEMRNFGSISTGMGEYGAREASVDLSRVLSVENETALRIIANHSESDESRGLPDRLDGVKAGLAKNGGEKYHLRIGTEMTDQRYVPDFGIPAIGNRPAAVSPTLQIAEPWTTSTTRNSILDTHADYALTDRTRVNVDWTHLDARSTSVRQSVLAAVTGQPGTFSRVIAVEPDTRRRIDSAALSFNSDLHQGGTHHELYAGLEYYREVLSQPSGAVLAPYSPAINLFHPVFGLVTQPASIATSLTTENLQSHTLTVQDNISWGKWTLVAGLQGVRQRFFYGTTGTSVQETHLLPKIALLHHLTGSQTVYVSYDTGSAPNQAASSSSQSLASRLSKQYELGWKSAWLNNRLSLDTALFWLDQNNMLADDPGTLSIYDKRLAGRARARGLELSLTGYVTKRFSVEGAYAYTSSRYLSGSEFVGNFMPNIAVHTFSLFGHYDWNDMQRSGLGIYAQGKRYADELNTAVLPGYGRLDAVHQIKIRLASDRSFELQLSVHNLLNKTYYEASHLHVSRYILPGEGRTLMVTGTYRF